MITKFSFRTVLMLITFSLSLGFYSCGSDDDEPDTPTANVVGKWEVTNQSGKYGSFEFTGDSKYIITQNATGSRATNYIIIIFGDYSTVSAVDNEYTLNLKEFGTIVINISGSGATITVNGETYSTEKAKEVSLTDKTKLLCHTWNYKAEDEEGLIAEGTLTYTTAGTYYATYVHSETPNETSYDAGTWEWVDSNTFKQSYIYSGSEIGYDNCRLIELTDKLLKYEFDDYTYINTVTGTR